MTTLRALSGLVRRCRQVAVDLWFNLDAEQRDRWLARRRKLTWLAGVAAGALDPRLLIPVALVAYAVQLPPRRASAPLLTLTCVALPVFWIRAFLADPSFDDPDTITLLVCIAVAGTLLAGIAQLDYRRRGTSEVRPLLPWPHRGIDPAAYGLPPHRIILGWKGRAWVCAPRQVGALAIGPPRSGKTTGVIIPNVMSWTGPVVVTSTRRDVLNACHGIRSRRGTVWCFDPIGTVADSAPSTVRRLDWSPVRGATDFDTALARARALLAGSLDGTEGRDHWRARGTQLLGALLHAAALARQPMPTVVEWVHSGRLGPSVRILEDFPASRASSVLHGLEQTPDRERGSIWSAVAGALAPFDDSAVLRSADRAAQCPFDPAAFLSSQNALFIVAPSDDAVPLAPLVVGLVEEVRIAALRLSVRTGALDLPLLLALDEIATICPLPSLPQIAAEGGGRNIVMLAVLQDLSQAAARWGKEVAGGLLTLAGAKLILPGLADVETLQRIETLVGKHWVQQLSRSSSTGGIFGSGSSWGTIRSEAELPRFAAAAVRELARGRALVICGRERGVYAHLADPDMPPFAPWVVDKPCVRDGTRGA